VINSNKGGKMADFRFCKKNKCRMEERELDKDKMFICFSFRENNSFSPINIQSFIIHFNRECLLEEVSKIIKIEDGKIFIFESIAEIIPNISFDIKELYKEEGDKFKKGDIVTHKIYPEVGEGTVTEIYNNGKTVEVNFETKELFLYGGKFNYFDSNVLTLKK